jgi:phenylpyruvate tautomerase PptA (4-oxalocrotonate tautomerase family)
MSQMAKTDDLSEALQRELVIEIGQAIKRHYQARPELTRTVVYEVLQALAFHAAVVLHGTDQDPEAVKYFERRFNELLQESP